MDGDIIAQSLDANAEFLQEYLAVATREQSDLFGDVVVALGSTNGILVLKQKLH